MTDKPRTFEEWKKANWNKWGLSSWSVARFEMAEALWNAANAEREELRGLLQGSQECRLAFHPPYDTRDRRRYRRKGEAVSDDILALKESK